MVERVVFRVRVSFLMRFQFSATLAALAAFMSWHFHCRSAMCYFYVNVEFVYYY